MEINMIVYKYGPLFPGEIATFAMPVFPEIIHFGVLNDELYFWALCEENGEMEDHSFTIVADGFPVSDDLVYLETCIKEDEAWHLFQKEDWT